MEQVQPWIWSACQTYLQQTEPSTSILNPSNPIRTGNLQFIRFLSKHSFGETTINHDHQTSSIWAEGIDGNLKIYIEISDEILKRFEEDQAADKRRISSLNFPVFSLGGCRWIWAIPPNLNSNLKKDHHDIKPKLKQLCLRIVNELPKKKFKFKAELPFRIPILNQENLMGSLNHQLKSDPKGLMFLAAAQLELQMRLRIQSDDSSIAEKQASEFARGIVRIPIIRRSTRIKRKNKPNNGNQQDVTSAIQTTESFQEGFVYIEDRSFSRNGEGEGNERRIYDLRPFAEIDDPKDKVEIISSIHDTAVDKLPSLASSSNVQPTRRISRFMSDEGNLNIPNQNAMTIYPSTRHSPSDKLPSLRASSSGQLIEEPRRRMSRFTSYEGNLTIPTKDTMTIYPSTRDSPSEKSPSLGTLSSVQLIEEPKRKMNRFASDEGNLTIPNKNTMTLNPSTRDSPSDKLPSLRASRSFQLIEKPTRDLSRVPPGRASTTMPSMNSMKNNQITRARNSPSDNLQSLKTSYSFQSVEKQTKDLRRFPSGRANTTMPTLNPMKSNQSIRDSPSDNLASPRFSRSVPLIEKPSNERSRATSDQSNVIIPTKNTKTTDQSTRDSPSEKLSSLGASSSVHLKEKPAKDLSRVPPGRARTTMPSMNSMKVDQMTRARNSPSNNLQSLKTSYSFQSVEKQTKELCRFPSGRANTTMPTLNPMKSNQPIRDSPSDHLTSLRLSCGVQLIEKPTSERSRVTSDEGSIIIPTKKTIAIDSESTRVNPTSNHVDQLFKAPNSIQRVENSRSSIDQTYAEKTNFTRETLIASKHPKHPTPIDLAYASKSVAPTRQLRSSINPEPRSSSRLKSIRQRLESIPISAGVEPTKTVTAFQNGTSKRKAEEVTKYQKEFVAARRKALMRNRMNSSRC
ncbi:uncharacterized protein MELLADRAFT_103125 [Melampsora larici-populina 98AG31]|uniref:Uncharacterized protein n=1 Tax=Melampsora larici-populina (strain 98AG31 / pathotype 3-4-7) TaxID=747676 RepID=F4RAM5_MELLP|nr:uncharacterized protein MELLADRAFT_103125 [Melampsora larici-populina 98AG31]EGG10508.1 hypothetical protein MELLADRAFT_103125 [Melampsora larici-populina 98AG31]